MSYVSTRSAIAALSILFAGSLILPGLSRAQAQPAAPPSGVSTDSMQTEMHMLTDVQRQNGAPVDSKEEAAYRAFFKVNAEDPDKKIKRGQDFLAKYPKSLYAEPVDVGLTQVFFAKQDWKNFYAFSDAALALKPNDVDVLTQVGWVIPHVYNPDDADADKQLDKAEAYEKLAIQDIATMPKPAGVNDSQFAKSKAQRLLQAHSALGLVYFRREDYANSAKELQQTITGNADPDQDDLFVLGLDLQSLNRNAEAADVFARCGQMLGPVRDRCTQNADAAKKQVTQSK